MGSFVTYGELMLRLKPQGHARLTQARVFDACFGGAEANVAVSIANFRRHVTFVTALPNNDIARAALRDLKGRGVTPYAVERDGRLGIYYLEGGAGGRPSVVLYDRAGSVFSLTKWQAYDWRKIFFGTTNFHLSGVTPAISADTAGVSLKAMEMAKRCCQTISLDLNYRSKLWTWVESINKDPSLLDPYSPLKKLFDDKKNEDKKNEDKKNEEKGFRARDVMTALTSMADILIANETDIENSLKINESDRDTLDMLDKTFDAQSAKGAKNNDDFVTHHYENLSSIVMEKFPNLKIVAITIRRAVSAEVNEFSAVMLKKTKLEDGSTKLTFYKSIKHTILGIVERVGAGDAFSAGLIYALTEDYSDQEALDFAAASGALKHTVAGDYNDATEEEISCLAAGDRTGRIVR